MPPIRSNPQLLFDFEDDAGRPARRAYAEPHDVWIAGTAGEVKDVLGRCQEALEAGLHVAGFLGYEAAPALDDALVAHEPVAGGLPVAWFASFAAPLAAPERPPDGDPAQQPAKVAPWRASRSRAAHLRGVATVRDLIAAGDTYQVNYTFRLRSRLLRGDPTALYRRLRAAQPAAYGAHLRLGEWELLSASPELFFRRAGDVVTTRPMKGTAPRGADPASDLRLAQELRASAKNRAENVMITDLLRNDLGRVALPGSVTVPRLLELESQPTFHALTSTVQGQVPPDTTLAALLGALFPCGSVTGAPKASTMRIIRNLEEEPRGAYCGTIGFAEPGGNCAFSVAIRTVQLHVESGELEYGTGGGITWDSDAADEYAEALLKAAFLPGRLPQPRE